MNPRAQRTACQLMFVALSAQAGLQNSFATTPEGPRVVCETVEGSFVYGRLNRFDMLTGAVIDTPNGSHSRQIAAPDIVRIEMMGRARPTIQNGTLLTIVNGDRLAGPIVDSTDESLRLATGSVGEVEIDLMQVVRIDRFSNSDPAGNTLWRDAPSPSPSPHDVLMLNDRRSLAGFIDSVGPHEVWIQDGQQRHRVPMSDVRSIRLTGTSVAQVDESTLRSVVSFTDGTLLTTRALHWTGDDSLNILCDGKHLPGSIDRLLSISIRGGRHVPLTTLTPVLAENVPLMNVPWPHRIDSTVIGTPIRVAGRPFTSGIGVHSQSRLVYELAGRYQGFITRFGIDDSGGIGADVDVAILIDGSERFRTRVAPRSGLHPPVRIDVSGVRHLELRVDFGRNGAVLDRFDWIEPALIRPPP